VFSRAEEAAQPTVFVLDEVVVTATREEAQVAEVPAHVTVVSREDIDRSSAVSIADILGKEGGLVVRTRGENDKNASVDIRGMGETSVSNVLVLVDGIRINTRDLSGPDFSTLSHEQVERIEIIRGAGSVLYGDNAVGGVINIMTRKPKGRDGRLRLEQEVGSYDLTKTTALGSLRKNRFHASILGVYEDTDGYRANAFFRNKNLDVKGGYELTDALSASVGLRFHEDDYGLPGPLDKLQFRENPRQTVYPDDHGESDRETYDLGLDYDFGTWGTTGLRLDYDRRTNDYVLLGTTGSIEEETWTLYLKHTWDQTFGFWENRLTLGLDYVETDYSRQQDRYKRFTDLENVGLYALDRLKLFDNWIVELGYRYNRFETSGTTEQDDDRWRLDAWSAGISYLHDYGRFFANYHTSFRTPNVDEISFTGADGIEPQEGRHFDLGSAITLGDRLELSLAYFWIRIEDEIWFDSTRYTNRNYDEPTLREGVEAGLRSAPVDRLQVWANYTFTEAEFENTDYRLPLVPKHKLSAGVHWELIDWLGLGVTYSYLSDMAQGGEPIAGRAYPAIPSYDVVDTRLTIRCENYGLRAYGAVNNVLDEDYYEVAYYDNVYPSPGRNFRVGLEWRY
jgi:iron complex outermembrane receptor protein